MTIDWNVVSSIASVLTLLVFAATAVTGVYQIRLTRRQLDELGRSTQLAGTMAIFTELSSARLFAARRFVWAELERRMEDEAFLAELELFGLVEESTHQELVILRFFENVGSYIRYGLIDCDVILHNAAPIVVSTWEKLTPVVAVHRRVAYAGMWENYELLYHRAAEWLEAREGLAQFRSFYRTAENVT